jgi:hypothetical protein
MTNLEKAAKTYIHAYLNKYNKKIEIAQARDKEMKDLYATTYTMGEIRALTGAFDLMMFAEITPLQAIEDTAFNELLLQVQKSDERNKPLPRP